MKDAVVRWEVAGRLEATLRLVQGTHDGTCPSLDISLLFVADPHCPDTSMDYFSEVLGVPYAYTFEVYGGSSTTDCFAVFNPRTMDEYWYVSAPHCVSCKAYVLLVGKL